MVTYYEMIDFIEKMKTAPRKDENINYLKNTKIDMPGNVLYRFMDHIIDLIQARLNNSLDNFIGKLKTIRSDDNLFSLEVLEIKKEIDYSIKIATNVNLPDDNKQRLKETIKNYANDVEEILENNAQYVDNTGRLLNIIKNHGINKLEV